MFGVFAFNLLFFAALERISAGRGALLIALNPATTALLLALVFRERLAGMQWLGIALALGGAWVVITEGDPGKIFAGGFGAGEAFMLAATLCWTIYGLIARFAVKGLTPVAANTYAALWGWGLFTIVALPTLLAMPWASVPLPAVAALAFTGLFGTALAFIWYYEGIVRLGPSRTSVFMNLVPIFSVTLAALTLGEPLVASMLVGGALTIAGVMLTNRFVRRM